MQVMRRAPRSATRTPRLSSTSPSRRPSDSIELTSAYFVPRPAFTEALVEAAERGVHMRILVPGAHIDKQFVRTAGRAALRPALEAGIEIYEY